jgi:hypothetical protein
MHAELLVTMDTAIYGLILAAYTSVHPSSNPVETGGNLPLKMMGEISCYYMIRIITRLLIHISLSNYLLSPHPHDEIFVLFKMIGHYYLVSKTYSRTKISWR